MADGRKCSVNREGFGLELPLLHIERIQVRWPGHWVRTSPGCPPPPPTPHVPPRRTMTPRRSPGWMHGWKITCSLSKQKNNPPTTHFKSAKRHLPDANHTSFSTLRKPVWNFCSSTACWVDLKRR